ncbi:MAG: hypothetical protein HQK49_10405 [Oligoflexia bacterium]|nr:hypothetical protein [Oligoflexia bacterium]
MTKHFIPRNIIFITIIIFTHWYPLQKLEVAYDFSIVIEPLLKINSVSEYLKMLFTLKTVDIRPITDISYFFDSMFYSKLHYKIFLISNLFYWLIIINIFHFLLEKIKPSAEGLNFYLSLILLTHPMLSYVTPWIVSRKHILSLLFILIYFISFLKIKENIELNNCSGDHVRNSLKQQIIAFLSYTLSVFSQPISALSPIPTLIYIYLYDHHKKYRFFIVMIISMISFSLLLNYYYFSFVAPQTISMTKFTGTLDLHGRLMGIGRVFFQILLPFNNSFFYDEINYYHLIGLLLGILSLFFFYKKIPVKIFLCWTGIFFSPLVILYAKSTNIFFFNTYALLPLVCFIILFNQVDLKFTTAIKGIFIFCFLFNTIFLFKTNKIWQKNDQFLKYSYDQDNCCFNSIYYADNLWSKDNIQKDTIDEAIRISKEVISKQCFLSGEEFYAQAIKILTMSILYNNDKKISSDNKIKVISNLPISSITKKILIYAIKARDGDSFSFSEMKKLISANSVEPTQYDLILKYVENK